MEIGVIFDSRQPGHLAPQITYVNRGPTLCDRIADIPPVERMDSTYSTYHFTAPILPKGFTFASSQINPCADRVFTARATVKEEYADHEAMGGFGPSRTPPRISFKLIPARGPMGEKSTTFSWPNHTTHHR